MDWSPSDIQEAIKVLTARILKDANDPLASIVDAEILTLESVLDITTVLVEVGRAGARIPVFPTLVLGAPIRQYGDGVQAGEILTAGLLEEGERDPRQAQTRTESGKLYGRKICVPVADQASRIVVPAQDGVYVAALSDCTVDRQEGTDDDSLGIVTFDGTPALRLGGPELLDWWLPRVDVGVSAILLGLSHEALKLTAAYVTERHQFGIPIGSFQAVQQRAADAWIQTQVMEASLWQAAWRVESGLASSRECAIARYHASEGSHFVCAAAQHLHGGFGFDRDYPLHRYFLAARQHEFILGGANAQLEKLGDLLAESPARF